MALRLRDAATDSLMRKPAHLKGTTLTETIRGAVMREYADMTQSPPLIERLQPIQAAFQALRRPCGQPADKAFFDALSGDL